jgi:carbon starvation protein CstA
MFTPSPGPWESIAGLNRNVADWCEFLRAARDGRTPAAIAQTSASSGIQRLPNGFFFFLAAIAIVVFMYSVVTLIVNHFMLSNAIPSDESILVIAAIVTGFWLYRRRGRKQPN